MDPQLTFFCELPGAELAELFSHSEVIDQLKALNAHISLGLIDLGQERAAVIRQLNQAGIPLHAWLLLPVEQGYWFNLDNSRDALKRYNDFKNWSAENNLGWVSVGLDIEPDIQLMQAFRRGLGGGLRTLVFKIFQRRSTTAAKEAYRSLVKAIRIDGWNVESYQFPPIVDERQAGSQILQKLTGIIDLAVDREVLMLYSSFFRPHGAAVLAGYGPDADAIGLGITGGGVDTGDLIDSRPLTWIELEQDLLLAARFTPHLYIFSLEGCIKNGYLAKILSMNWQRSGVVSSSVLRNVNSIRKLARGLLWGISRVWPAALALLLPVVLRKLIKRQKNRG